MILLRSEYFTPCTDKHTHPPAGLSRLHTSVALAMPTSMPGHTYPLPQHLPNPPLASMCGGTRDQPPLQAIQNHCLSSLCCFCPTQDWSPVQTPAACPLSCSHLTNIRQITPPSHMNHLLSAKPSCFFKQYRKASLMSKVFSLS